MMMEATSHPKRLEPAEKFVNDGLAEGRFRPLVAKTFPLDRIGEAPNLSEADVIAWAIQAIV
jgi:hypothetical protein